MRIPFSPNSSYLPSGGLPGVLTSDYLNPSSTSSGAFGGLVVALKLNVDFADAGLLLGSSGILFGDLTLCNLSNYMFPLPLFDGLSVRQLLGTANTTLGGGSGPYSADRVAALTFDLGRSFLAGTPSQFFAGPPVHGVCP